MEGVAPPFAAVLFDLDGVLRNTEPYHRMAYAQLARSLSGGAPPDAGEIAGKSNLQLYEALVARFGGPATAEELSQRHFRLVCQLLEEYRVGPMPGLEEALSALRRRGIPFGVVSSSWRWYVERCLRELDMYEDAAVIVTGSDGLPLKPARFHNFTIGMCWVVPQTGRTFVSASADMCSARAPLRYREGVTPRVRLKALEKVSGSG